MVCLSKFTTSECCPTSALCRIDVDQPAQLESRLPHRSMVADMFLTESRKTMFLRSPFSERTSVSQCGPQTLHYSLVWVKILFAHVYYDKSSFWLVAWSNLIRASPPPHTFGHLDWRFSSRLHLMDNSIWRAHHPFTGESVVYHGISCYLAFSWLVGANAHAKDSTTKLI